tara:strand:+ start:170 stop:805 length:636 start_codon:yes stop_codon:yes gene_type:complete
MTLVIKDRVKETTETDGTGALSLAGAATGFQTFVAAVGDGNTTYYAIEDANGSAWEVGIGTIADGSPDTLTRTAILASSNSGSAISLTVGNHTVFGTYPAGKAIFLDANGVLTLSKSTVVPYTTITTDTTVTSSNVAVFANATSGAIDVTLYAATSNGGKTLTIKKTDSSSNTVDIIRAGGETIDGVATVTLNHQNESITLMSDNSNWFIV